MSWISIIQAVDKVKEKYYKYVYSKKYGRVVRVFDNAFGLENRK